MNDSKVNRGDEKFTSYSWRRVSCMELNTMETSPWKIQKSLMELQNLKTSPKRL